MSSHQHRHSQASTTTPDVCRTPAAPSPVPIPYPVVSQSMGNAAMAEKVKLVNKPTAAKKGKISGSHGNEAGILSGMTSASNASGAMAKPSQTKVKID